MQCWLIGIYRNLSLNQVKWIIINTYIDKRLHDLKLPIMASNGHSIFKLRCFNPIYFSFFRRQLLERDHNLRAAHDAQLFGALHHQQIQQQEEALLRLQGKTPRP